MKAKETQCTFANLVISLDFIYYDFFLPSALHDDSGFWWFLPHAVLMWFDLWYERNWDCKFVFVWNCTFLFQELTMRAYTAEVEVVCVRFVRYNQVLRMWFSLKLYFSLSLTHSIDMSIKALDRKKCYYIIKFIFFRSSTANN